MGNAEGEPRARAARRRRVEGGTLPGAWRPGRTVHGARATARAASRQASKIAEAVGRARARSASKETRE